MCLNVALSVVYFYLSVKTYKAVTVLALRIMRSGVSDRRSEEQELNT